MAYSKRWKGNSIGEINMIKSLSKMVSEVETYLSSRPLIANDIVDKYEIVNIRDIGSTLIGACGVGDSATFDVKIKGTFDRNWQYLITLEVEDYYGLRIKHKGVKRL